MNKPDDKDLAIEFLTTVGLFVALIVFMYIGSHC